jgi:hypothetical protein
MAGIRAAAGAALAACLVALVTGVPIPDPGPLAWYLRRRVDFLSAYAGRCLHFAGDSVSRESYWALLLWAHGCHANGTVPADLLEEDGGVDRGAVPGFVAAGAAGSDGDAVHAPALQLSDALDDGAGMSGREYHARFVARGLSRTETCAFFAANRKNRDRREVAVPVDAFPDHDVTLRFSWAPFVSDLLRSTHAHEALGGGPAADEACDVYVLNAGFWNLRRARTPADRMHPEHQVRDAVAALTGRGARLAAAARHSVVWRGCTFLEMPPEPDHWFTNRHIAALNVKAAHVWRSAGFTVINTVRFFAGVAQSESYESLSYKFTYDGVHPIWPVHVRLLRDLLTTALAVKVRHAPASEGWGLPDPDGPAWPPLSQRAAREVTNSWAAELRAAAAARAEEEAERAQAAADAAAADAEPSPSAGASPRPRPSPRPTRRPLAPPRPSRLPPTVVIRDKGAAGAGGAEEDGDTGEFEEAVSSVVVPAGGDGGSGDADGGVGIAGGGRGIDAAAAASGIGAGGADPAGAGSGGGGLQLASFSAGAFAIILPLALFAAVYTRARAQERLARQQLHGEDDDHDDGSGNGVNGATVGRAAAGASTARGGGGGVWARLSAALEPVLAALAPPPPTGTAYGGTALSGGGGRATAAVAADGNLSAAEEATARARRGSGGSGSGGPRLVLSRPRPAWRQVVVLPKAGAAARGASGAAAAAAQPPRQSRGPLLSLQRTERAPSDGARTSNAIAASALSSVSVSSLVAGAAAAAVAAAATALSSAASPSGSPTGPRRTLRAAPSPPAAAGAGSAIKPPRGATRYAQLEPADDDEEDDEEDTYRDSGDGSDGVPPVAGGSGRTPHI